MIAPVFAQDIARRALGTVPAEDRILLLCTRQEFGDSHIQAVSALARQPVDWEQVFLVADAQGVSPLVGRNLARCQGGVRLSVPGATLERFRAAGQQIVSLKAQAAAALEDILAYLAGWGLEAMLLTTAHTDRLVYQDPALTFGRDLDLVIRAEPGQLTPALRAQIAAFFTAQSRPFVDFVAGLGCDHEFFEYDFFAHHDLTLNGTLTFDFSQVWRDSIACSNLQGRVYHLMCAEDLLISLCISSFRKRYFRLKNLCDVAECARVLGDHPDPIWRLDWGRLAERARSFDAQNLVYVALLCAQQHLQASVPAEALMAVGTAAPGAWVTRWLVQRRSFCRLSDYTSLYRPVRHGPGAPQPRHSLAVHRPSRRSLVPATLAHPKRDLTMLLPLASYRPAQLVRKLRYVVRGRAAHAAS